MQKKNIILIIIFYHIYFLNTAFAESKTEIINYILGINNFSSKFIQTENESFSEGNFYLQNNRLKVEYLQPSSIEIILAKNKAMYFNKDLQEVEYFNPNKTIAKIFYDVFNNERFFTDANLKSKNAFSILEKDIVIDDIKYKIDILFENKPLIIRKVIIDDGVNIIQFGIINIDYFPDFEKNFFSMSNPMIK